MANGDTIVSTGIAPDVLVCIGTVQFRSDLTAVPLMKGYDLGSWEGLVGYGEPLNRLAQQPHVHQTGRSAPHVVSGDPNVQPCGIKDHGLPGLRNSLSSRQRSETTDLQFGRWGELFEQLASPQFWEYQASQRQWTAHRGNNPRGRYKRRIPVRTRHSLTPGPARPKMTSQRQTKVQTGSRSCGTAAVQEKSWTSYLCVRQSGLPTEQTPRCILGIIRGIDDFDMQLKQTKDKNKRSRPKLGASTHGMTEGEKRRLMKETGPVTKEIPAETVIKRHIYRRLIQLCVHL